MSDTPTKIVVNCSTGEQQIIELTAQEIAQRDQDAAEAAARREEEEAAAAALTALKASAKAKLVAGEPLTEAEAATLVI
jgi:3-hydroxyisobutyrate dehydrogenase-like beta-hydroxyacid dehydrogenase